MDPLTSQADPDHEPVQSRRLPHGLDGLTIALSVLSACVVSYALYSLVLV